MTELKRIANKHKYAIFIFAFIFVYNFVVVKEFSFPEIDEITYTYHIVDYSIGFCTKLLPGAIYNAIFSTTDAKVVNLYFTVIYHIFLALLSFMLEIFLKKFNSKDRLVALVLVLFFITGPATFSIHTFRLGMLDTYWLFFSVLFIVAIQNKVLKWFIPVLFVSSFLIHVSAMVSFVPFFALIVLLEAMHSVKNRKANLCIFGACVFASFVTFIYFTSNESSNLMLNVNEFRDFISGRNLSLWDDYTLYYDFALFRISYLDGLPIETESGLFVDFLLQIKETFRAYKGLWGGYYLDVLNDIIVCFPIVFLFYKYIFEQIKQVRNNKLWLFMWLCSLFLLPLVFVIGILCSPDITRWFGHSFLVLFALIMYNIYRTGDVGIFRKFFDDSNFNLLATVVYFVFYATCVVDPYC